MNAITDLDASSRHSRHSRRWARDLAMIITGALLTVAVLGVWDLSTRNDAAGTQVYRAST
ncbi:hypothetical protein [Chitinasiproducens palmae]|uniref:hypothetical protein n=1 Tax=Chitinasiproducens palmae TaxID=1770053 RepID=UPI001113BC6D|nr:hypothetical protein [Chitinasiproducens palmae]